MKTRRHLLMATCLLPLCIAGCKGLINLGGPSTPISYYSLCPASTISAPKGDKILAVERFRAAGIIDDDRIAQRGEDDRIQQLRLHRWAAPPADMVRQACVDAFRKTGRFAWVDRSEAGKSGARFRLEGELHDLCIVRNGQGQCQARLALTLRLVQIAHLDEKKEYAPEPQWVLMHEWSRPIETGWSDAIAVQEDAPAFSTTLARLCQELARKLAAEAAQTAEGKEGEKGIADWMQ